MKNAEGRPRRRSLRLKDYDYSQEGAYFMTVCVQDRRCLFGEVIDGAVLTSPIGQIVQQAWNELPKYYPTVKLDQFVAMPNHIHGIVFIHAPPHVGAPFMASHNKQGAINRAPTLGEIVRTLKAASTRLIRLAGSAGFSWQRNYYDHVIRNETELTRIREYIVNNPLQWALDREHPGNVGAQFIAPASDDIADIFGGVRP